MESSWLTLNYLTLGDILTVAEGFVDIPEFLNEDRLLYTLEAVEAKFGGVDLYPTLFQKAAVYAHHIITGHVFLDGNKRTGLGSAFKFLELNGFATPVGIDDEIIALGMEIAEGDVEDIEAIAERLRAWFF